MSAGERLAFGGADRFVGASAPAEPARAAEAAAAPMDAGASGRDLVAYRALLAFTFVLFTRRTPR